jgi:hypothetical protein
MRKVQLTAVVWTMILAVPLTAIALSFLAYTTENLTQIATSLANFSRDISAGGRGALVEFAQRWPEIAGMFIGQAVLLTILIFARQANKANQQSDQAEEKQRH